MKTQKEIIKDICIEFDCTQKRLAEKKGKKLVSKLAFMSLLPNHQKSVLALDSF